MALSPLATVQDLSDWIGEPIEWDSADAKRAEGVLRVASRLVRAFLGKTASTDWPTDADVPDGVSDIVCQSAARSYVNPEGWGNERVDDWGGGQRPIDEWGVYLTDSEKAALSEYSTKAPRGIGIIATTKVSGDAADPSLWVPTENGPLFPWY